MNLRAVVRKPASGEPLRSSSGLKLSKPSDAEELEADRVADALITRSRVLAWSFGKTAISPEQHLSAGQDAEHRNNKGTTLQRKAASSEAAYADPAAVQQGLRSSGNPLDSDTRTFMESRLGQDFSRVRIHVGDDASHSARALGARAFTVGDSIVFNAGHFSPRSAEGRRLLAHELTHVVQQSESRGTAMQGTLWRQEAKRDPKSDADEFVDQYGLFLQMTHRFEDVAHQLFTRFIAQKLDYAFVRAVIEKFANDDWDDNIASNFVDLLGPDMLSQIAGSSSGRLMLDVLYNAMITGSVSDFERKQADRILLAKTKRLSPEDFIKSTKLNSLGRPTQIFPVRNMGVTRWDAAPLTARLLPDGKVWAQYPTSVRNTKMFANETKTLPVDTFLPAGQILNPNEIVGIKDYESGEKISYLPALALIDYANRVERHTLGTIADVVLTTATMGAGAGASAAGRAGVWAARFAFIDKLAIYVHIASVIVNDHRNWIVEKLGKPGKELIHIVDVADEVAGIYGLGRLGHGAFELARKLRAASRAAREEAVRLANLNSDELKVIDQIDSQTNQFAQDMEKAEAEAQAQADAAANAGEKKLPTQQAPEPHQPIQPDPSESHAPAAKTKRPGTIEDRTMSREEWKAHESRRRWKKAVDAAFEGDLEARASSPKVKGGEKSGYRIGDKSVPSESPSRLDLEAEPGGRDEAVPRREGETGRQAVARVRNVVGKRISDFPTLEKLWNDARQSVLSRRQLTPDNYVELYNATRDAFWRRVRSSTPDAVAARQILNEAGVGLSTDSGAARLLGVGAKTKQAEFTISLDHIAEKAIGNNWQKALDADNLRFEFAMPNTNRENIQMRHPELRP